MKQSCYSDSILKNVSLQLDIFKCKKTQGFVQNGNDVEVKKLIQVSKLFSNFQLFNVYIYEKVLEERCARLAASMINKKFHGIRIAEVLVGDTNAESAVLKTHLIEDNEHLN